MMCCMFCVSFRGAAYFGTTAQILIGLAIVIRYSTSLPDVKWSDFNDLGSGPVAILFSYGVLIFAFGCFIFRGIETESLRTLKVSVGGLTILQCLVLLTHLVLISLAFDTLTEEHRMTQVSVLAVNLVITFIILTILFLYMIRLAKREVVILRSRHSNSSQSSIPLSATGSYLTAPATKHREKYPRTESLDSSGIGNGRYSVGSSTVTTSSNSIGQRYIDGQWENLHV